MADSKANIQKVLRKEIVVNLKDATSLLGNSMAVYRLVEKGELSKVYPEGLGFFSLPETEEGLAHFAIVSKYYPQCVVSGKTALSLYDLSLDYIRKIDVDIPKTTNLVNELLEVHRVVKTKINNVVTKDFKQKGVPFKIQIYSAERALFEAHKYYSGTDAYFYALKKYRELYLNPKSPGKQYDIILKINKKIGKEMINLLMMSNSNE
jgi:hypothetical protein